MRVAFAGTPEFALPALAALAAHHDLVGVLTQPDRPKGRGRQLSASAVKGAAEKLQVPIAQPPSLKDEHALATLAAWEPQVLVVVAYGLILPARALTLPRYGCLNIHASLLPRWRGAAPIQRAILAGDAETGISIMQMDAGLDTGAVLLQRRHAISADDTAGTLQEALAALGAAALLEVLEGLPAGTVRSLAQPDSGATYAPKIDKSEAVIDWGRQAIQIERQVRAFNPWPTAETRLNGDPLRILSAHARTVSAANDTKKYPKMSTPGSILAVQGDSVEIQCGEGILAVTRVQRAGRRPVSARDFANSASLRGLRLG